ncbi:hypothetical protein GCM10023185_05340 [Hymenobacter saemangeumensis]|uniref:Uncharacterized protein n=1 Tax=Hymenobacter saemangeumensis TaxID=1084522 RepID=A0ABP8I0N9_9BACT
MLGYRLRLGFDPALGRAGLQPQQGVAVEPLHGLKRRLPIEEQQLQGYLPAGFAVQLQELVGGGGGGEQGFHMQQGKKKKWPARSQAAQMK